MAKILIVDDEIEFCDLLGLRLERAGQHEVIKAYEGESAVQLAQTSKPDLIILDIAMPKMSGFEVIEALDKIEPTKNIPIIILTASTSKETTEKIFSTRVKGCVVKPFNPPELMKKIGLALGGKA
ncbi:hypothetical protein A2311_01230 [candidate division WOR-1 bacterium RIFOXYB2_FULL_48_7]|uniref:Response regulatory domain-containing protein n=1 Tax=candidate division WOR-1 bacterium RIFOXYB2_FULL_48_7 TaxID=1802583 RepID=A0A1F4TQG4_UNCSA|nr:MAG: hypothetical protein A2311_01230 [candidate division WOR-1 bacterium RIFOXYB2_FULL_48_7]